MKQLPSNVTAYKKTPEFDQDCVPAGLLHEHQTKAAVWGKIVILAGQLQYTINQPELEVMVLDVDRYGVVEPTVPHEVKPLGQVRFYVEFYK